jgi:hypothetical protein
VLTLSLDTVRSSKSITISPTRIFLGDDCALGTLLRAARMRAISSGVLNGLVTKSSAPASSAATLSSSEFRTVSMTIATSLSLRIALHAANPPTVAEISRVRRASLPKPIKPTASR